jgi:beta-phosphoglucomutase
VSAGLGSARAALKTLGVLGAEQWAVVYAERQQKRLEELIDLGGVTAFPGALRFVQFSRLERLVGIWRSHRPRKNANQLMQTIRLDSGQSLLDIFNANVCCRDLRQGKPNAEIFLSAAAELRVESAKCRVGGDAVASTEAGRMAALGAARVGNAASLRLVDADRRVTSWTKSQSMHWLTGGSGVCRPDQVRNDEAHAGADRRACLGASRGGLRSPAREQR